jgi:Zn-dependent peptidase ImmA (M78 family)
MELDGKTTPDAIVSAILRQNPEMPFPVPLGELAPAAGIQQIAELQTEGFEGMLMTNPEKSSGVILVKANGNPQRRRFTIAHELGHYLLPWHRKTEYSCATEGIKEAGDDPRTSRLLEMEQEANAFASELLMPTAVFRSLLRRYGEPDLEHVQALSAHFDTSIQATAHRFLKVSDYAVAFVFSRDDTITYWTRGPEFPFRLRVRNGSSLPQESLARGAGQGLAEMEALDSLTWLSSDRDERLPDTILEQTLFQRDGFKVTMLYVDELPEEDDD